MQWILSQGLQKAAGDERKEKQEDFSEVHGRKTAREGRPPGDRGPASEPVSSCLPTAAGPAAVVSTPTFFTVLSFLPTVRDFIHE